MRKLSLRTLVLLMAVLMIVTSVSVFTLTASAATAPAEGMTFVQDSYYEMTKVSGVKDAMTIEASIWIAHNASDGRHGTVIGNYSDDSAFGGSKNTYGLEIYNNGAVRFFTQNNGNFVFNTVDVRDYTGTDKAPKYVDIAVTADTVSHTVSLYINGELKETQKDTKLSTGYFGNSTYSLCVGGDRRAGNGQYFKGQIKDVKVYADIRTAEEIAAASAEGYVLDTADTNLKAAFDLTSADPFTDLSTNKNNLKFYTVYGEDFAISDPWLYLDKPLTEKVGTYEALIYCPTDISRTGVIMGNYNSSGGEKMCLNFEIHSDGTPSLYIKNAAGVIARPKFNGKDADGYRLSDVRRNGWVHLVIVDDGANFYCYIDGELTETLAHESQTTSKAKFDYDIADVQSVNTLTVGRDTRDNQVFKGKISHIAYYSEPLSASEIKSAYKNGVDTDNDSLLFYYDMSNGGVQNVVKDESGNGYHASTGYYAREEETKDYAYSFAIVGDTQKQVWKDYTTATDATAGNETSYTANIYKWLVDNKDAKNIQWVFGVGDITENNGNPSKNSSELEWEIAKEAIIQMDAAGMNYSLVMGNHDTSAKLTEYFNEPFYTNRISGYYQDGSLGNYYINFEVAGVKYMVFALEYGANDKILKWAGEVIDANPERRVIITTHAYMFRDGTTLDKGDVVPPNSTGVTTSDTSRNNGDMMWEKFVSQHRNIMLVFSGHDPYSNIAFRQDKGVYGNTVSQFLVDPQSMDVTLGMVCMLYFSEDGREVSVEWISTGKTQAAQASDPDAKEVLYKAINQFEFETYNFDGNGVYATQFVSRVGNIDTYRILYTNGTCYEYTVENGLGLTVTDVQKVTNGLIDTYTIYFSDGSSTTYTVKNGADGKDGNDGKTPYIGENGNWWIGTVDTGVRAEGGAATEPDYGNKIVGGSCGGNVVWMITDKNILVIEGKGSMTSYAAGKTPWVEYATVIEEIVIGEGVTTIGNTAFYGFTSLESVKIPSSLLSIGEYAFFGCAKLSTVTVPSNTRVIGKYAFRKSGLTSITLRNPENWTVKGITTPDNLDLAGVAAAYITKEYYTYEWSVKTVEVGDVAASGLFGDGLIWILTTDGTLTVKGEGSMGDFSYNTTPWYNYVGSIFTVVIEDGVTDIGRCAFYGADQLTTVIIPETVTAIDVYAFYGAASLESVTIPASVKVIGGFAFAKCPLASVTFGNADGWTAGGAAILNSELLDPTTAAQCVAINARVEWKVEDETAGE